MNRFNKISELYKSASKIGRKGASGMNFSHAELALAEENWINGYTQALQDTKHVNDEKQRIYKEAAAE